MFDQLKLSALPLPARVTLTAFLALIGFGYLAALGNLYYQHQLADGRPGLNLEDLRVVFHGAAIERSTARNTGVSVARSPATSRPSPPDATSPSSPSAKSRMLEMIEPGAAMRKNLIKGGEPAARALTTWLERGARREEFEKTGLAQPEDPSPTEVISDQCLNCHNAEAGERKDTPYGPDLFSVDYAMVFKYAAPGTAKRASGSANLLGPMPISHLFLITHVHMLTIPVFTLIVAVLFLLSDVSARLKCWLAPAPMVTLLFDFAGWFLARAFEPAIYVIAAAGAVFGLCLALQLLMVLASLWRPQRRVGTQSMQAAIGLGGAARNRL